MDKYVEEAKKIIAENIYMTISTASIDGTPWISPVFFAYDENYNLYWVSYKKARHSKLLKENPQAAIAIYNSQLPEGEGDGVYFECRVEELENEKDVKKGMEIMGARVTKDEFRVKKIEDVTELGVWRIYKATPFKISKLTEGNSINGQYIDKRVEISLK